MSAINKPKSLSDKYGKKAVCKVGQTYPYWKNLRNPTGSGCDTTSLSNRYFRPYIYRTQMAQNTQTDTD